jgi:glucose-1-phosphatase
MTPLFLYFDLGNVILHFDHRVAARQIAVLTGLPETRVWDVVFASGLELRYESGELDDCRFYEEFCRITGSSPDQAKWLLAGSEIFKLNTSIVPVLGALKAAGYRMGILSNTCPAHWSYCRRYGVVRDGFDVYALSYEHGTCKPDPSIYAFAAELAGVKPEEIFYADDIPENVDAARRAGFDAVQHTSTPQLVEDLRSRGLRFNY